VRFRAPLRGIDVFPVIGQSKIMLPLFAYFPMGLNINSVNLALVCWYSQTGKHHE
jgi:hypothetical protein